MMTRKNINAFNDSKTNIYTKTILVSRINKNLHKLKTSQKMITYFLWEIFFFYTFVFYNDVP